MRPSTNRSSWSSSKKLCSGAAALGSHVIAARHAFRSFFRMQINTRIFTPHTLHYSANAEAAASSPVIELCSSTAASDAAAAAAANDDDEEHSDVTSRNSSDDVDQPLVIVTAASADFFNNSLNLIGRHVCTARSTWRRANLR